jgi:hypothetical protein
MAAKMQKRVRNYTVRLPPIVITPAMSEKINAIAKAEETSLSEVVRYAIDLFLESRSRKSTHKVEKQLSKEVAS